MYRLKIRDNKTGDGWYEYHFTKSAMQRVWACYNETDDNFYLTHDLLEVVILDKTFKTFKKCLTKATRPATIFSERERR